MKRLIFILLLFAIDSAFALSIISPQSNAVFKRGDIILIKAIIVESAGRAVVDVGNQSFFMLKEGNTFTKNYTVPSSAEKGNLTMRIWEFNEKCIEGNCGFLIGNESVGLQVQIDPEIFVRANCTQSVNVGGSVECTALAYYAGEEAVNATAEFSYHNNTKPSSSPFKASFIVDNSENSEVEVAIYDEYGNTGSSKVVFFANSTPAQQESANSDWLNNTLNILGGVNLSGLSNYVFGSQGNSFVSLFGIVAALAVFLIIRVRLKKGKSIEVPVVKNPLGGRFSYHKDKSETKQEG